MFPPIKASLTADVLLGRYSFRATISQPAFLNCYAIHVPVVDVGINREDGKLYGDCQEGLNVFIQTPVPGGVGLLTRLSLLENLMEAYKNGI